MSLKKAGLVGLLAAAALAIPASAATVEDLQAQVNALLAQLASLQGGSSSSSAGCYSFTADLTEGSTGADVTALQNFLAGKGFFSASATGYFGPITKAAVAAWQSANGVMPAAGYFGAISRAKYNMMCGTTSGGDDNTSSGNNDFFTGDDEGSLENFDQVSSLSNEKVGEDEEDVPVLGVEFDADGADQMVERVTVVIDTPSDAAQDDLEDFIQDVSVWLDGEELDRMDVADGSYDRSNDEYTFRFVGLDGIVQDGDTGRLEVAVTGPSDVNGDNDGEGWDVEIPSNGIRASSPNGVTETYDGVGPESFTVESFATANDVELKATKSSDNPAEQTIVGDSDSTFDADLLGFTLKAKGSDIDVFGLTFALASTTANAASSITDLINDMTLSCGGDDWSENTIADGSIVFGDVEFTVDEGDSVDCMLSAEMNEIDGTDFSEGDSVRATLTVLSTDAEDQTGEGLSGSSELSGSANGLTQTFISEGLQIDNIETSAKITATADPAGGVDKGTFTVSFDATANGNDVYLDKSVDGTGVSGTAGEGVVYTVYAAGSAATSTAILSATLQCVSDCGSSSDNNTNKFFIADGDTETYRLTVVLQGDSTPTPDEFKVWLDSINWTTSSADANTADQFYTSNLGEETDADTGFLFLDAI